MRLSLRNVLPKPDRGRFERPVILHPQRRDSVKEDLLKKLQRERPNFFSRSLLVSFHGSFAYGIHPIDELPHDLDLLSVSVPGKEYYLGWQKYIPETFDGINWNQLPVELVDHEIKHFFLMLLKSSPNILPLLWTKEEHLLYVTETGRRLLESRNLFASKQFYEQARGFASSCLHNERQPRGYYHAIRTLRMAREFLDSGRFQVNRAGLDAQELLLIKSGLKPKDEILELYESALRDLKRAHQASKLPEVPDSDRIQKLLVGLIESHWQRV